MTRLLRIIFLVALFCACSKEQPSHQATESPKQAKALPAESTEQYTGKVKIKTPDDATVVEIKFKGADDAKIEFGGKVLRAKNKDSGKRKYEQEGGPVVAEVKSGDDGFKVRTPDGKLLWKVKFSEDKIKISDNEENANPFELKMKDGDRVKITKNDSEIGEVKFYKDRQKVKVKAGETEKYESNTDLYSGAYGVLLMDAIPEQERNIIIAELLMRGK